MKKQNMPLLSGVRPDGKCECHGCIVFDGTEEMASRYTLSDLCADSVIDYALRHYAENDPLTMLYKILKLQDTL